MTFDAAPDEKGQPQRAGLHITMETVVNLVTERKRSDYAVVSQRIQMCVIGINIRAPITHIERIMFFERPGEADIPVGVIVVAERAAEIQAVIFAGDISECAAQDEFRYR